MSKTNNQSYLERLKFDPKLNNSWVARYIGNIRIVLLLVLTIVALGIASYLDLPRRLNPEIKIPIITVITILPGASPEDIESLVTIPLENELKGLSGIDTITSSSRDNVSAITMQFFSTVAQEKAKSDTQNVVDSLSALPEDAQTPRVNALDFEDQPIWVFALKSTANDLPSLMRFGRELESALEEISKVDRVTVTGIETQEVVVEISPEKVNQYGINPLQLSQLIKIAVAAFPAGSVSTAENSFAITIDPVVQKVADLRTIRLTAGQQVVRLGDIATVSERSLPNISPSYLANQETDSARVITFSVYKTQTAKIDAAQKEVEAAVTEKIAATGNRFSAVTITNSAEEITRQFSDLVGEFRTTILLVFGCLFIFLGLRQAIISSFTVPLTFLSAFVFMNMLGMSINFLSLFAFLLALGLLVDDTIVVVSAMTTYFRTGKFTPFETGLLVWRDTIVPIWSTTITTIWSFVPLLLSAGIIGEFIKPIPVVVTVTMISSTAIAVLITLPFMIIILRPYVARRVLIFIRLFGFTLGAFLLFFALTNNPLMPMVLILFTVTTIIFMRVRKHVGIVVNSLAEKFRLLKTLGTQLATYSSHGFLDIEVLSEKYHRLILRILASQRARRIVVFGIVLYALLGFILVPLGLVKNEFFPKVEADTFFAQVELPAGTTLTIAQSEAQELLEEFRKTAGIEFVVAQVGSGISDFGGVTDNSGTILFTLHLPEEKKRTLSSIELAEEFRRKYKNYVKGKFLVIEQSGGPPAGADVQIQLLGNDLGVLDTYAELLVQKLEAEPGVTNVQKSIKPGTSALVFAPSLDKLSTNGVDLQTVGMLLRTYASGFTLDSVRFGGNGEDEQDIVFRYGAQQPDVYTVQSLFVTTPQGSVPISSLGSFKTKANPTIISREAGKRTISVSAAVLPGNSVADKNQQLLKFTEELNLQPGYSWKTGGVNEENARSVQSIIQAMGVSALLILVTMVVQFKSYRQAAIVLLVIPLAVSSVFWIFALTGTPLSFPALIGVLSLFGIVVTNSMFIVDKINLNQKQRMPFNDAIADAGASRLEPIILTKLATVLGLLPITLADPLWRGLGGAIISGLLIASSIMLLFIPVVYFQWFKGEAKSSY